MEGGSNEVVDEVVEGYYLTTPSPKLRYYLK
jgi:hypothetical protein